MPSPGFYNDNRNRAFPFIKGTVGSTTAAADTIEALASDVIVDAGFVMGLRSAFNDAEHTVYLAKIRRIDNTIYFDFASSSPALEDKTLTFTRSVAADMYETEHAEVTDAGQVLVSESVSVSGEPFCDGEPLWAGYVVTGALDAVLTLLPGDGEILRTDGGEVEPALIVNLADAYVGSLNVGNGDRTRVDAPAGCDELVWPHDTGEDVIFVNGQCLRGDVRFKPGYNSVIRQESNTNTLIFGAVVGAGEGQPCEQVPLFDGEVPPAGSDLLEGGLKCNQVIRSLNGSGGQYTSLLGGTGVRVTQLPEQNKIVIDVDMNQMSVCYSESSVSEVSETL